VGKRLSHIGISVCLRVRPRQKRFSCRFFAKRFFCSPILTLAHTSTQSTNAPTESSTYQHTSTSTHQHINTIHHHINNTNTSTHQHINTPTHQHINTSTQCPRHINTSTQSINTPTKSSTQLHINTIVINTIHQHHTIHQHTNTPTHQHKHTTPTLTQSRQHMCQPVNTSTHQHKHSHQHVNAINIMSSTDINTIINTTHHQTPRHQTSNIPAHYPVVNRSRSTQSQHKISYTVINVTVTDKVDI
jgi:hypothetical protein